MTHIPYADRLEAGDLLGIELSRRQLPATSVVLALARGGVPVGFAVAKRLGLPLDVIVARKLGVPWQPELAMGALAGDARVINTAMLAQLDVGDDELEKTIAREQAEMKRREALYRGGKPAPDLSGETVILVDDGLATGSTMLAAIRHVRSLNAAHVIVAVPVGSADACDHLRREVDELICLSIPDFFYAVGEWYRNFEQVGDNEVKNLLAESHARLARRAASPVAP